MTRMPDFKGYLSDVGAPSANMYRMGGRDRELPQCRRRRACIRKMAPIWTTTTVRWLYEKIRAVKGVKRPLSAAASATTCSTRVPISIRS